MSTENISKLIETILTEKRGLLVAKVHEMQESIMRELEAVKDIKNFDSFSIPKDLVPETPSPEESVQRILQPFFPFSAARRQTRGLEGKGVRCPWQQHQ